MSRPSLKKLKTVLDAAAKNGIYFEGALFEIEPETSLKLYDDRAILLHAAKKILSSKKWRGDSLTFIALSYAVEMAEAGWPSEDEDRSGV